ncbi:MAG: hypothetical protein ACRDH8_05970 [Actinomycetota bacterium]
MVDTSVVLNLLIPVLVAVAVASRGFRVDEAYVERWATSAGLPLTEEDRRLARRFLLWSRRSRTLGGLIGWLGPFAYAGIGRAIAGREVMSETEIGGAPITLMLLGYLLGGLFAELVVNRPRFGTVRMPRRLEDYLSRYLLVGQRGLGVLVAVMTGVLALIPLGPSLAGDKPVIVTFGLIGVAFAIVLELLQRAITRRRQDPRALELDDAMRSTSVHLIAGAGVAILLGFTAGLGATLIGLAGSTSPLGIGLIAVLFPLSIAIWLDDGKPHGFRVRRIEPLGANA